MNASIYVLQDGFGRVKLGISRNPKKRSRQFGPTVSLAHDTGVLDQARKVEKLAHHVLALHGKHVQGEWFEATVDDAISAIEVALRQAANGELSLGGKLNGGTSNVREELQERVKRKRKEEMVRVRFDAAKPGEVLDCLKALKRSREWHEQVSERSTIVLLRLLIERPELLQLLPD